MMAEASAMKSAATKSTTETGTEAAAETCTKTAAKTYTETAKAKSDAQPGRILREPLDLLLLLRSQIRIRILLIPLLIPHRHVACLERRDRQLPKLILQITHAIASYLS
jgi:hypothetical protein